MRFQRLKLPRIVIWPATWLYGKVTSIRGSLFDRGMFETRSLNSPVISVGNLTFGGTGKTPCVELVANMLNARGLRVCILSRGYKRLSKGRIEVSDGNKVISGPSEAGDEAFLLATNCPGVRVVVDSDRYSSGRWISGKAQIDVFILDDGYQHRQVKRDLNLLLIDASRDLPEAGPPALYGLREPVQAIGRADAVIVTRADLLQPGSNVEAIIALHARQGTPVFHARHLITGFRNLRDGVRVPAAGFRGRKAVVVSGIADPLQFEHGIESLGVTIKERISFTDHHRYSYRDLESIDARCTGDEVIITTEKDAANIAADDLDGLATPVYAALLEFRVHETEAFSLLIERVIQKR